MDHQLKLVKLDADKYYWHTEQETDDGGYVLFNGDEVMFSSEDEHDAKFMLEWELQGGIEMIDGKLVEKKGILG